MFIEFHDGSFVTAAVAVVWRGEDGNEVLVVMPAVAVYNQLMRSAHKCQFVRMIKLGRYVFSKDIASATW